MKGSIVKLMVHITPYYRSDSLFFLQMGEVEVEEEQVAEGQVVEADGGATGGARYC